MKTIYGFYWRTHFDMGEVLSSSWLETLDGAKQMYDELVAEDSKPTLFQFDVEDDATEEDISDIMDGFMTGRLHLVDMNAQILR